MKKILILYAKYGGGHSAAANAIQNYIDNHYENVETNVVDCIEYINKALNKISTSTYKKITSATPRLWKKVYHNSERGILSKISNGSNKFMARKLYHFVEEYSPDIIISTHMFSTQMISYLKRKNKISCKLATILTDFAPHDQWLVGCKYGDFFFVSNDKMKDTLINDFSISKNKVFATGIPLSEKFKESFDKKKIFEEFGLNPEKKTILFFGGGEFGLGKEKTVKILGSFIDYSKDYQIVAIAGKNEKMKKEFEKLVEEKNAKDFVKVLPYTNKVPELMSISDLVVTKPGGLTSTESLASGLPMIIINPIPGQEEENAEFLENSGVAIWIRNAYDCDDIISEILSDPAKLHQMKVNTKLLAKKNSTKDICKIIFDKI